MKTFYTLVAVGLLTPVLAAQDTALTVNAKSFRFDTSGVRGINILTNNINSTSQACFTEMRSTVVNLGVTNANCHVVYIPALSGTFRSRNALQVNATASHVRNASGQPSGKLNASGALETCRVLSSGSACWGATLVSQDTAGAVGVLNGLEVDVNLQNAISRYVGSAANPTGVRAVMVGSNNGAIGTAFMAQKLGPGLSAARWSAGFLTTDSGASTGLSLGSLGSSPNQGGQPIVLHYRDNNNHDRTAQINVDGSGNLLLQSGDKGNGTATINPNSFLIANGRLEDAAIRLNCGATQVIVIDASQGNYFICQVTSNVAVTIQPPIDSPSISSRSQLITIAIRNASGGALRQAPTFSRSAGGYKFSPVTNPANNTQVLYTFRWDPIESFWYEVGVHQASGL
jgi:hypothetical protein